MVILGQLIISRYSIYISIYIYLLKFEITPNTTSKLLVDWMFIDDICEHDRLVSAFDCLLQDDSKPQYGGVY